MKFQLNQFSSLKKKLFSPISSSRESLLRAWKIRISITDCTSSPLQKSTTSLPVIKRLYITCVCRNLRANLFPRAKPIPPSLHARRNTYTRVSRWNPTTPRALPISRQLARSSFMIPSPSSPIPRCFFFLLFFFSSSGPYMLVTHAHARRVEHGSPPRAPSLYAYITGEVICDGERGLSLCAFKSGGKFCTEGPAERKKSELYIREVN